MERRCLLLQDDHDIESHILNRGESHEQHGHPPLTDAGTKYWMKWEEWNPGLLDKNQANQIQEFDILTGQALEWFLGDSVLFPSPPPINASYESKQDHLIQCFNDALKIALPDHSDPPTQKQQLTQTSLGQYRLLYQPLKLRDPSKTIRLLEILPAGQGKSLNETRLFNTNLEQLENNHKYEALSYAWGAMPSQRELRSIRVNGLTHRISPNLHDALSSLRLADRGRTLWVDSICINQGDLKERTKQVMLMAKIYAKAKVTAIYLGQSTPETDAFFRFLNLPVCQPKPCDGCGWDHSKDHWQQHPGKACAEAGLDEPDVLRGFIDVFSRKWWESVWILQEYTLSRADPDFYCGGQAVSNSLFTRNFSNIYYWVLHRKRHPNPVRSCKNLLCNSDTSSESIKTGSSTDQADVTLEGGETLYRAERNEVLAENYQVESQATTDNIRNRPNPGKDATEEEDGSNDQIIESDYGSFWKGMGMHIYQQQQLKGLEWRSWGRQVWKAEAVLERRSKCRPWHSPDYIYKSLKAKCTDPHDVVYGVRELMEPAFRDIFPSDYTMPVPRLYTKLAVYLVQFHFWLDMFWHYPHRLGQNSLKELNTISWADLPSWVPDFTLPALLKDADKAPVQRAVLRTPSNIPQIIYRVLFMRGWLLDEIFAVFPLPMDDPFRVLQQLWYVERVFGRRMYTLIHRDKEDEKEEIPSPFSSMMGKLGGITSYPSVAWATKYSEELPDDISLVHLIENIADFGEREGKGLGREASPEEKGAFWAQCDTMNDRIATLLSQVMRNWTNFVGICTFDFEGLRAQVQHRLLPVTPRRPLWTYKSAEVENLCNPPLRNATLQMPLQYSYLLTAIAKNVESNEELKLRQDAVMCIAQVIHNAAIQLVGGPSEVTYVNLGNQSGRQGDNPENYFRQNETERGRRSKTNDSPENEAQEVVDDFILASQPDDITNGEYPDGPRIIVWGTNEELHHSKKSEFFHSKRNASRHDMKPSSAEAGSIHGSGTEPHSPLQHTQPCVKDTRWRRIENRKLSKPHMILTDLVDFLAGRELFVTGPGTQGVCDGDDLFLLQNMSFPLIGRLEPSETLGNPKKRRREQATKGMQREIIGSAIVQDLDPTASEENKIVLPDDFEPLSGMQPGRFRFK